MSEAAKRRYASGVRHPMKGKRHTVESRRKMSDAVKAHYEEHEHPCVGRVMSAATRRKIGEANEGNPSPMKGKKHSEETRRKLSEAAKKRFETQPHPFSGKSLSDEHRKKISETRIRKGVAVGEKNPMHGSDLHGKKNPNWKGGASFEPYSTDWTNDLKESIRKRDRYTCRQCGKVQEENKRKLDVHHIDYDKENLDPKNLIALCMSCHRRTNGRREHWTPYFRAMMEEQGVEA